MKKREKNIEVSEQLKVNNAVSSTKLVTYLIFTVIFVTTSFLSILFIYKHFGDKTSLSAFSLISSNMLVKILILLFFYYALDILRFFYVLKTLDINVEFKYMIKLGFINIFISNITPFATGGGFAQIYFLNKKGVPLGDATAASTIRTIIPIVFFFTLTPIILLLNKSLLNLFPSNNSYIYIGVFAAVYIFIAYLFIRTINNTKVVKNMLRRILSFLSSKKLISKKREENIIEKTFKEMDSFAFNMRRFFSGKKQYVFLSIACTILFLLSLFMFPVILIKGLNNNVSSLSIISLQVVITFMMYFAPTPGATGVAEGGFSLIFSNYVAKKYIVSLTFTWRFFTMYLGMIIGMIVFYLEIMKNRIKIKRVKD